MTRKGPLLFIIKPLRFLTPKYSANFGNFQGCSRHVEIFNVCIARSTGPFPLCIRGGQYSISTFRFPLNFLWSDETNTPYV